MRVSKDEALRVYCKTCNVQVDAKLIGEHAKLRLATPWDDPVDDPYDVTVYRFAVCPKCESPFLLQEDYVEVPGEFSASQGERVLYPRQQRMLSGERVPKTVRRALQDAERSYDAGLYEPCVIMCRKGLEAMCYELGETKGSLRSRLCALRDSGKVDSKLIAWADALRMVANDAAHGLGAQIGKQDAIDSLHFVEALAMYLFSLNVKHERFMRRRKAAVTEG